MNAPNTWIGLVLFVLLLMPGFTYTMIRDRSRPVPRRTILRDLISIIAVSCVSGVVSLLFFFAVHLGFPSLTPDVGELIGSSRKYLSEEYPLVGFWFLVVLVLSVLMAAVAGSRWIEPLTKRLRLSPTGPPVPDHTSNQSAWWVLFTQHHEARVHVGCFLDNGDYVAGWLFTFDNSAQDTPERELTLSAPITHRSAGSSRENILENVGAVSVSAAKIAFLSVGYVEGDTEAADQRQLRRLQGQTSESAQAGRSPVEWEPPRRGLRRIFSGW